MNIIEIFEQFPTQEDCIKHLENVRWPEGPVCPYCGSKNCGSNPKELRHYCNNCKTSFSVTVGTIFHRTHLPLQKWFLAISLILNAKKGISALQLSRDLKVNKNTAWRIGMQVRKSMSQKTQRELLSGVVEMDECYIGGAPRKGTKYESDDDKPKKGRGTNKTPVIGAVERGGKVKAKTSKKGKMNGKNLQAFVKQNVDVESSRLMTDEYGGYSGMSKVLPHSVIRHQIWYVDGDIHTNTIEGFWALLKRGMFGQFHSVSVNRLQMYVDEFCYRYNHRNNDKVFQMTIAKALGV